MENSRYFFRFGVIVLLWWPTCMSMGDAQQSSILKEPAFAELEEGSDIIDGIIKDEGTVCEVTQLSFFGHTTCGGIRREADDSMTKLDLSQIKSIKIKQEVYASVRYPEKEFSSIQKTSLDGAVTDNLLVPRHVIICGIEKRTHDQKAWYLNKIDELIVHNQPMPELPEVQRVEQEEKYAVKPEGKKGRARHEKSADTPAPKWQKKTEKREEVGSTKPIVTQPVVSKEQHREMEVKIVEKDGDSGAGTHGVMQAVTDFVKAAFGIVKAVWEAIKRLFV